MFARLWLVMAQTFGNSFVSQYGETPNEAWITGLRDVEPHQISRGLMRMGEEWESGFPPNMIQFRRLCVGTRPQDYGKDAERSYDQPQIEDRRRVSPEFVRAANELLMLRMSKKITAGEFSCRLETLQKEFEEDQK